MPNSRRPRSPNADAEAAASIAQAEAMGLIPPAGDSAPLLDVSLGETTRERDYRANAPRPRDGVPPFKVAA
jgi:hypothetical protein